MQSDSLQSWLVREVREVLDRSGSMPPLLLWCDPQREWLDLLRAASEHDGFELWAPAAGAADDHELLVRDRFCTASRAARVVWLPCGRDEITWFKTFELEAEAVWEKSLLEGLREYGVAIPREHESELLSLLPAHAREWFDKPKKTWEELTPANAKSALVDDHRMLQVLGGTDGEFERLRSEERFDLFARRAVEDFGLPDPRSQDERAWRVAATARLLCTEAAEAVPHEPPSEGDRIVPAGLARKRALDLLKAWQNHVLYIATFEDLARAADATVGLGYWARNLPTAPRSRSSRLVEKTIFDQAIDRLDRIEDVQGLAKELEQNLPSYQYREKGFWAQQSTERIGWRHLIQLADVASLLVENHELDRPWKNPTEAVQWYERNGWQLDLAGERLFREATDLPPQMHRIRARLRRGYLRTMDRISRSFSELLTKAPEVRVKSPGRASGSPVDAPFTQGICLESGPFPPGFDALSPLPTAGELVLAELQRQSLPTALVFLDACRLDLGQRLKDMLNKGEPIQRANVSVAAAPVPSITAIGMAMALPISRDQLSVQVSEDGSEFLVTAAEFSGNLAVAEHRRRWLTEQFGVRDHLGIDQVLDGETLKRPSKTRRMIAVYGAEFDQHDGQLQLTGAEAHLQRYVQAIRRLRDYGYSRVIVTTDHGFFHWDPEEHEMEEKPSGKLLWLSRRAMVGRNLSHPRALHLQVPCSDLEVMVPRGMNSFRTHGGLEFFHGGATLQELVIPVVVATWPAKARKVKVVLKPVEHIAGFSPRVQLQAGATGQSTMFADSDMLARQAFVKVRDPANGKVVFKHREPVTVDPDGAAVIVQLEIVEPRPELAYNTPLEILVIDADDEEILAREAITLKVAIDDWS
jgi:hypothetical protein